MCIRDSANDDFSARVLFPGRCLRLAFGGGYLALKLRLALLQAGEAVGGFLGHGETHNVMVSGRAGWTAPVLPDGKTAQDYPPPGGNP